MSGLALLILLVFGVMGFSANLFYRVIFLYEEWQDGNDIHWWLQAIITFAVPGAFVVAIFESMAILGFFSHQSERFF